MIADANVALVQFFIDLTRGWETKTIDWNVIMSAEKKVSKCQRRDI